MNRRRFLSFLGLAPVAAALPVIALPRPENVKETVKPAVDMDYAMGEGPFNGSSHVAKVITQGVLPTNTTNWNLVALRGEDGTGTGDVSGPSSSVASRIAVFNGTTGKQIADSGVTVDQIRANTANVGAAVAGANGQSTINDADTATGVLSGTGTLVRWTWGNIKAWIKGWITKSDVGLGNVSNLAPADLPVSTVQQAALNSKLGTGAQAYDSGRLGNETAAQWQAKIDAASGGALLIFEVSTDNANWASMGSISPRYHIVPTGGFYRLRRTSGAINFSIWWELR